MSFGKHSHDLNGHLLFCIISLSFCVFFLSLSLQFSLLEESDFRRGNFAFFRNLSRLEISHEASLIREFEGMRDALSSRSLFFDNRPNAVNILNMPKWRVCINNYIKFFNGISWTIRPIFFSDDIDVCSMTRLLEIIIWIMILFSHWFIWMNLRYICNNKRLIYEFCNVFSQMCNRSR